MIKVNHVVLSSNSSPTFLNFWPLVSRVWKESLDVDPILVFLYKEKKYEKLIPRLEIFGQVIPIMTESQAPIQNQAKLARWYVASKLNGNFVTVDDIDSIFTSMSFLSEKLRHFEPDKLLGIGSEVYGGSDLGKFPASSLSGYSQQFANFFSIKDDEKFENFVSRMSNIQIIDGKENPFNRFSKFSDESLIRSLRKASNQEIKVIERNLNFESECIDRLNWPASFNFEKIRRNIVVINLPRPLYENRKRVQSLLDFYFQEGYPWLIPRRAYRLNPDIGRNFKSDFSFLSKFLHSSRSD